MTKQMMLALVMAVSGILFFAGAVHAAETEAVKGDAVTAVTEDASAEKTAAPAKKNPSEPAAKKDGAPAANLTVPAEKKEASKAPKNQDLSFTLKNHKFSPSSANVLTSLPANMIVVNEDAEEEIIRCEKLGRGFRVMGKDNKYTPLGELKAGEYVCKADNGGQYTIIAK